MQQWAGSFRAALDPGLVSMGLADGNDGPWSDRAAKMAQYAEWLYTRNQVMNLTAITEPAAVARLHFLDSLMLLQAASLSGKRVIDVGTGGGFPGLPLKIADPSIRMTLLDSQQKRVAFLEETVRDLGLADVTCIQARAEEQSRLPGWREQFDCAVSRAVADLRVLLELCLPFVRVGGVFLAMKSMHCNEEIAGAQHALAQLGGVLRAPYVYDLPETEGKRQILVIEKTAETPDRYPRRFAKIQKDPL